MVSVKRGILLAGCAVAFASAPLLFTSPASAEPKTCPYGTQLTNWGDCVKSGSNAPSFLPPGVNAGGAVVSGQPGQIPSVNGIPCTDEHWATCYAMQQNG